MIQNGLPAAKLLLTEVVLYYIFIAGSTDR